jgi:hypothetical protein
VSRVSTCRCLICDLERTLMIKSLECDSERRFRAFARSRPLLSPFQAALDLIAFLHTRSSGNGISLSDPILSELLQAAATDGDAALRDLLLLVFIPMLHGTSRQVASRYPSLAPDDISQHVVLSLLQILGTPEFYGRASHVAFAIARELKRQTYEWAVREARSAGASELPADPDSAETFERSVLLRHFLHRCLEHGLLTDEELELLVQFKLAAVRDRKAGGPAALYSNASRQRMKRLLSKLRRIAGKPPDGAQLRLF